MTVLLEHINGFICTESVWKSKSCQISPCQYINDFNNSIKLHIKMTSSFNIFRFLDLPYFVSVLLLDWQWSLLLLWYNQVPQLWRCSCSSEGASWQGWCSFSIPAGEYSHVHTINFSTSCVFYYSICVFVFL